MSRPETAVSKARLAAVTASMSDACSACRLTVPRIKTRPLAITICRKEDLQIMLSPENDAVKPAFVRSTMPAAVVLRQVKLIPIDGQKWTGLPVEGLSKQSIFGVNYANPKFPK